MEVLHLLHRNAQEAVVSTYYRLLRRVGFQGKRVTASATHVLERGAVAYNYLRLVRASKLLMLSVLMSFAGSPAKDIFLGLGVV